MTSQDGINWTLQSAPDGNWDSVVGCNGTYVATASAGSPYVMYSTDTGSTWTVAIPAFGWDHQQLACNPNGTRFVSSSHYGRVWSSANGISWIAGSGPIVHLHAKAFAVLNGVNTFVMLEYDDYDRNGTLSATSTNGTAFAAGVYNSNLINGWEFMTYADNKFVVVAQSGNNTRAAYSTDGVNWILGNGIPANAWEAVAYGNGTFVAVASSGSENRVATSADGITWAAVTLDNTLTSVPSQNPPQEDSQLTPSTVLETATTAVVSEAEDTASRLNDSKTSARAVVDSPVENLPRAGISIDVLWISLLIGAFGAVILLLRKRLLFQQNQ